MQYYFLATALPDLNLGVPPELDFYQLETLLKENLTPEDQESLAVLRRFYDLENIRFFWLDQSLDPRGNLDENLLEEALLEEQGLPSYVYEFMAKYDSREERLRNFSALFANYFRSEIPKTEGFLHAYLNFEREWRLVFTGFRAKAMKLDLYKELQFEDPQDDLVAQILAQKDAERYEPPARYESLKPLFEDHYNDPLALHQALCEYRFHTIEEMIGVQQFTLDKILAYVAQHIIVEKWLALDKRQGMIKVDSILKEVS